MRTTTLATVPASELTSRLYELRGEERRLLVEFLVYLAEVDRRRLHLELGFSSLFVFLSQHLGYSNSAAYRRSTAARLVARFPIVAAYLGDGRLSLTTLVELRDVLDHARLDEVLARAAGRSEDEVKRLVAAMRPRPAVPDSLRRLPVRTAAAADTTPAATAAAATEPACAAVAAVEPGAFTLETQACAPPAATRARARIAPLSATQHLLKATVSEEFVRDLEEVRALLSHKLPGAGLEAVLHECLRVTLAACHKRRRGAGSARPVDANATPGAAAAPTNAAPGAAAAPTNATPGAAAPATNTNTSTPAAQATNDMPRTTAAAPTNATPGAAAAPTNATPGAAAAPTNATPGAAAPPTNATPGAAAPATNDDLAAPPAERSRYISAAVRDEVWRRDGGRCVFVGTNGQVCASRYQLEVHHLQAFARGGAAAVDALALRCRVHNRHEAERDFGRPHVQRAIERARGGPGRADPRQVRLR